MLRFASKRARIFSFCERETKPNPRKGGVRIREEDAHKQRQRQRQGQRQRQRQRHKLTSANHIHLFVVYGCRSRMTARYRCTTRNACCEVPAMAARSGESEIQMEMGSTGRSPRDTLLTHLTNFTVGRLFGIPVRYPSGRVSMVEISCTPKNYDNKVIMSAGGQLCGCVERDADAERRAAADYAQGRATRSSRRRAHV